MGRWGGDVCSWVIGEVSGDVCRWICVEVEWIYCGVLSVVSIPVQPAVFQTWSLSDS